MPAPYEKDPFANHGYEEHKLGGYLPPATDSVDIDLKDVRWAGPYYGKTPAEINGMLIRAGKENETEINPDHELIFDADSDLVLGPSYRRNLMPGEAEMLSKFPDIPDEDFEGVYKLPPLDGENITESFVPRE